MNVERLVFRNPVVSIIRKVPDFRIQLVTSETQFAELGDQWQKLAALDEQASLFNDWDWNSLWWAHYQHLGQLHVLLVFCEEQLVGIGPFYRTLSVIGFGQVDTLRFIGTGGDTSPDDLNVLAHPRFKQEVANSLCDHLFKQPLKRMLLADVSQRSAFYQAFKSRAINSSGYALNPVVHRRRCADLPDNWAGYRQQISRNTHKQIKRRQNRLLALGNVQFKLCRTEQQVDVAFESLVRLHVARWQTKGQSGSFGTDRYLRFHQALMRALLPKDQLWLITFEVNNEIVAVEYAFLYKRILLFFQSGFNPDYEHLSPGHALMTFAIKRAIESGVRRIDLLKGDYRYKSSYANQELSSADLRYYVKGLYGFIAKMKDQRVALKVGSYC